MKSAGNRDVFQSRLQVLPIHVLLVAPLGTVYMAQPTFTEVKEKFDRAMQLGSNEERVIHEFRDQTQISFDGIASEDFSAFMRILSLSKLLKNPNNMRGKARPQPHHGTKKKKRR